MSDKTIQIDVYKNCVQVQLYYKGLVISNELYDMPDAHKTEHELHAWYVENLISLQAQDIRCVITSYISTNKNE